METGEDISDTELLPGLPPDFEDMDPPKFLNNLREMARPFLSLSKGVPSPTKQLRESGNDKLKESRAKKRLFRGKQEPPNGVIERRYGYIPNPRWSKHGNYPHGRQYSPQGVGDGDRNGVPGVVFREHLNGEELHSGLEDFPKLPVSQETRLSPAPGENKDFNSSHQSHVMHQEQPQNSMHHDMQMLQGRKNTSLHTSTPVRCKNNSAQSLSSSLETTYHSAIESVGDSPLPLCNSISSGGSQSACISQASKSGKRRQKRFVASPLLATTPSPNNLSSDSCKFSFKSNGSWSDITRNSQHSYGQYQEASSPFGRSFPSPQSGSDVSDSAIKWSNFVSRDSSASPSLPRRELIPRSSPMKSEPLRSSSGNLPPNKVKMNIDHKVTKSWSNIVNGSSPSPGQHSQNLGSSDTQHVVLDAENRLPLEQQRDDRKGMQSQENPVTSTSSEIDNQDKDNQRRSKQRKGKGGNNHSSHQNNQSLVPWQENRRKNNSKQNVKGSSARGLTLESFLTPQRGNTTKKGNNKANEKKDIAMLESRFIENIVANPTSPPKKIRPSPIKRVGLSNGEKLASEDDKNRISLSKLSDGGDVDSFPQLNVRKSQNQKELLITKSRQIVEALPEPKSQVSSSKKQTVASSKGGKDDPDVVVFSLNRYFASQAGKGDNFEEENEDADEYPALKTDTAVQQFWEERFVPHASVTPIASPAKEKISTCDGYNTEAVIEDVQFLTPLTKTQKKTVDDSVLSEESLTTGRVEVADPNKVQNKRDLETLARQYCHIILGHRCPNLAVEFYFVIQLLTCTEVDREMLKFVDEHLDMPVMRTVHDSVYFAVKVIQRFKRMFAYVEPTFTELLADSQRIKDYSPSLHSYFKGVVKRQAKESANSVIVDYTAYNTEEDGTNSFPDSNHAHVFKCQRDNFYAFYRHYNDTSSIYEFKIENQIQYVYDGCTQEQNSMVNLMHLAKLYVDHLILCCVTEKKETVDLLQMIRSKGTDETLFTSLYEAFFESTNANSGTACPAPGFLDHEMFFRDFLETLSSPAFNEHLKNLLVVKILELNSKTFSCFQNLHSASTVRENETPLRCQEFTDTVLILCILAKVLGFLTFAPYTSGYQSLSQQQASSLLTMREMTPLPLPIPLILRQAYKEGHLALTVPWVVEYLALMDCMAPQLSIYRDLLKKLHFIQGFAWHKLYKEDHTNSALLIVSCISWLFESPAVPAGFFYSHNSSGADFEGGTGGEKRLFTIDTQKLVTQSLLTRCCPYLAQGQVLLTLFALKQKLPACDMAVIPLTEAEKEEDDKVSKDKEELAEIERWLGSSISQDDKTCDLRGLEKRSKTVIDDEVVPAYVLTRMLVRKDDDDLDDLEQNLLLTNHYMKSTVENTVNLLCAKVADYTNKTILRLLVFTCKMEVRQRFQDLPSVAEADHIKTKILMDVNRAAGRLSDTAKSSYFQVAELICAKELPSLLKFLSNSEDEKVVQNYVQVARKMLLKRLSEWATVQLGPDLFRHTVTHEACRCARVPGKPVALYPGDYTRKTEEYQQPEIAPGFVELEQLSDLIDTALSYGVWYINALTPGQKPNTEHILKLIKDFTSCVEKKMITMDFAFYVMSNFLMHLIVQYMVDAPSNWTEEAEKAFVQLCVLCKCRKLERDHLSVKPVPPVGCAGRRPKPGPRVKVKVMNLLSVHTLAWLAKAQFQDDTMMVYCRLLHQLIVSGLLHVETVCTRLLAGRDNKNLSLLAHTLANRAVVKVLATLYWTAVKAEEQEKSKHVKPGQELERNSNGDTEIDQLLKDEQCVGASGSECSSSDNDLETSNLKGDRMTLQQCDVHRIGSDSGLEEEDGTEHRVRIKGDKTAGTQNAGAGNASDNQQIVAVECDSFEKQRSSSHLRNGKTLERPSYSKERVKAVVTGLWSQVYDYASEGSGQVLTEKVHSDLAKRLRVSFGDVIKLQDA